ncbi:MAG: hypothetical protein EBR02_10160 [Alphaproteobacteria bacterium]|nr:hypothetical protein [Alphaproteobacteria bacterium]
MIAIRRLTGEHVELPEDARFVEILDFRGRVAILLYENEEGEIVLVKKNDPEMQEYLRLYGLVGSKTVVLKDGD